jgi:hypothetical protein
MSNVFWKHLAIKYRLSWDIDRTFMDITEDTFLEAMSLKTIKSIHVHAMFGSH